MAFDRFNEKPPRRERRFGDRQNFGERFGDRGAERPFDRFSGRGERQQFDRRDHRDYEGRPAFGDRPRFSGKPGFKRFEGQGLSRFESATRSGPRAKAVETRRFAERNAFVQTATVRLDADVAKYFKTAEDVNRALRQVVALAALVKAPQEAEAPAAGSEAEAEKMQASEEALEVPEQSKLENSELEAEKENQEESRSDA